MKRRVVAFVVGLAVVCALPFVARPLRPVAADRCALNGVTIDPAHAVRLVDVRSGASLAFCCPACADTWMSRTPGAWRAFVVDEETGREIDAAAAWFATSEVVAVPATDSRVHSFATEAAARRHAGEFRGRVLAGDERPLRRADGGGKDR